MSARFALGDLSFFAEAEAAWQRRRRRGPLFGEVAERMARAREATRDRGEHLKIALAGLALDEITPGFVTRPRQEFQRGGKLAERTITTRLSVLRLVLGHAVREGLRWGEGPP